jgi:hypothetical protein
MDGHQTVATIIARAYQYQHLSAGHSGDPPYRFCHSQAGIFHETIGRQPVFSGFELDRFHLGSGCDFHFNRV